MMMCQYKFINCDKYTTLVGDADNGRGYACADIAFSQFCFQPKTALKNNFIKKKYIPIQRDGNLWSDSRQPLSDPEQWNHVITNRISEDRLTPTWGMGWSKLKAERRGRSQEHCGNPSTRWIDNHGSNRVTAWKEKGVGRTLRSMS